MIELLVEQLAAVLIIIAVIVGILYASRQKWPIEIVADSGGVRTFRGVPLIHQGTITEFFQNDLSITGRVRVRGQRQKCGLVRLHIDGDLDAGARQRIRNFLLALL